MTKTLEDATRCRFSSERCVRIVPLAPEIDNVLTRGDLDERIL